MTSNLPKHVTIDAFVLAGGQSSRMGEDKGLIPLNGKAMVSYIIQTLQKARLSVKLIANHAAYRNFSLPVYGDVVINKGPMGGLLTALENTSADLVLLVGCDMPLISVEAIAYLISSIDREHLIVSMINNKPNPLFSLYPSSLKTAVREHVMADQLKMTDFILNNKTTLCKTFPGHMSGCFQNINDKAALLALETNWEKAKLDIVKF